MDATIATVSILAPANIPEVSPGDDIPELVVTSLEEVGLTLESGDILVLAQKIVSKAEGRLVRLASVTPSQRAIEVGLLSNKDPRLVELVLRESSDVVRAVPDVLIVEHRLGFVLANAGIDQSNVDQSAGETVLLLPEDPNRTCEAVRNALFNRTGVEVAVMIIDSIGRAWRNGTVGTVIGLSGMPGLIDLRGRRDSLGRPLRTSELGFADEAASAASLIMGQADERRPLAIIRGLTFERWGGSAAELLRPKHKDLFR